MGVEGKRGKKEGAAGRKNPQKGEAGLRVGNRGGPRGRETPCAHLQAGRPGQLLGEVTVLRMF